MPEKKGTKSAASKGAGGKKRAAKTSAVKSTAAKAGAAKKSPARKATVRKSPAAASESKTRVARKAVGRKSAGKLTRRAAGVRAGSDGGNGAEGGSMAGKTLVVVESPAKARTIGKYLGSDYRVKATVGHIIDLPAKKLGIDVEKGYKPEYVAIPGKEKTIAELKSAARDARAIYLATDPDREGEAIAWHVAGQLRGRDKKPIRRVLFHEITREAVQRAMENAGEIDERKVEAQQARRVLDRLVGYKASPLLWKTVKKGLSAGRVQTVALRLIAEREMEIRAFRPVEYWTIAAALAKGKQEFTARLHQIDGKKPEIGNEDTARGILSDLDGVRTFTATEVKRRERRKNPAAPFTTSTLQQDGAKKLGFGSKRTMRVAQSLYEGIDLGNEGLVGLITYMRTDSTRIAESAATSAREYLHTLYGAEYLAKGAQLYGGGGGTGGAARQDAHEAVRPTDPARRPDEVKRYLNPDQFKLYQLIWQRFMASQMAPAVFDTTTLDFDVPGKTKRSYLFRATGSVMKFAGFLTLYREAREDTDGRALEDEQALPAVGKGETVPVREITPTQHFTEPPPRFSEASLVKELERLGIGRPSTYAQIISVLVDRHYVELEQRRFTPTELGETVSRVMVKQFPEIFDVAFTSTMEGELDKIEDGELTWKRVLDDFYLPFDASLKHVKVEELIATAHDLSRFADERCPDCGGRLVPRGGFFGPFLACERHPKECKHTRPLRGERQKPIPTDEVCHLCSAPMVIRQGRSGQFLGCSTFPRCRGTRSVPTGIKCPNCSNDIIERQSRKRRQAFYACASDSCDFVIWNKPVAETCPECGYVGAEAKTSKARGEHRKCLKCTNEWDVEPSPEAEALAG